MWRTGTVSVTGIAQPEEVPTLFSTDGLLPILGVQPMIGRVFSRADDAPGGAETVVLTAGYWRAKFGADPAAVGRTVTLDGKPREIIGVLPDAFRFLDRDVSLIVPFRLDRSKTVIGMFSYSGLARLKPGEIDRAGPRRRGADDPDGPAQVPAVPRRHAGDVREGAPVARDPLVEGRPRRRRPGRALGADGDHRHGPADRVRQRRQPAARPGRIAAAGAGGEGGPRRQLGPDRPRAAAGKPDAGRARRRRGCRGRFRAPSGCSSISSPATCRACRTSGSICRCSPSPPACRCCPGCCSGWCRRSSRRERSSPRRCGPGDGRRARARSGSGPATCSSWRRSRSPSSCWSAPG